MYPIVPEKVPVWALVVASLGVPILCFALYQIWARSPHDFHHATLGLLEGFALTILLTALTKVFAGSYRPFYGNLVDPNDDSRKSFVSGHASLSFHSATFLSLWLCGKLGVVKKTGGHVWTQLLVLLPMIGAGALALSRTRDYQHNFVDVLAGALLGGMLAFWNYHLKYPPLWKKNCELPKRRWQEPYKNQHELAAYYDAADRQPSPGLAPSMAAEAA
jgi:membrane-associated phospholipid phosphatase